MTLKELIDSYFFSGYTIFNTLVYGIILILFLILILKLFEKIKINPESIIYSIIPFIFFGSTVRALVDNNLISYNYFVITPGIYILVGIIAIISLFIGYILKNRIDYKKTLLIIGSAFAIYPILKINNLNLEALLLILSIFGIWVIVFLILKRYWSLYKDKINLSIILAHILDATCTFVGVDYYFYREQHVVPVEIYNIFDTAITMYPLKIIVISTCLYLIDKYIEDDTISGLLKLVIFVLGLAPGLRNLMTIIIGT